MEGRNYGPIGNIIIHWLLFFFCSFLTFKCTHKAVWMFAWQAKRTYSKSQPDLKLTEDILTNSTLYKCNALMLVSSDHFTEFEHSFTASSLHAQVCLHTYYDHIIIQSPNCWLSYVYVPVFAFYSPMMCVLTQQAYEDFFHIHRAVSPA